jgi:hypothetical protein
MYVSFLFFYFQDISYYDTAAPIWSITTGMVSAILSRSFLTITKSDVMGNVVCHGQPARNEDDRRKKKHVVICLEEQKAPSRIWLAAATQKSNGAYNKD